MAAAVIGLIAVQLYWLANLIRVEDERFHRTVNESLRRVSKSVEQEEAAHTIFRMITPESRKKSIVFIHKSTGASIPGPDLRKKTEEDSVELSRAGNKLLRYRIEKYFSKGKNESRVKVYSYGRGSSGQTTTVTQAPDTSLDTLILKRKKLVQDIVTEITEINIGKKIEDRVSVQLIDKLLNLEFKNSGLNGDYFFGINKLQKDSLTLLKNGSNPEELKKSDLRTLLFPAEFFYSKNELIVYFPGKTRMILGTVAGMAGLSILLIIIIVAVFYQTVQMFVRQKKLTQVKNDLINNITHEFKTPISTISLACEAINEPELSGSKESITRYSNIIKEENGRLKTMVDALLNAAAMEKGDFTLKKEAADLHEIIRGAVRKFDQITGRGNGKINLELNAPDYFIYCDPFHTGNIFTNLIDNAIKYNNTGTVITITTSNCANYIIVTVDDNGIGIPKEHLGNIFETFYRVESGNIQSVRGNGIGLSYSKKIVEAQEGTISVESESGKGSRFEIHFPVKKQYGSEN